MPFSFFKNFSLLLGLLGKESWHFCLTDFFRIIQTITNIGTDLLKESFITGYDHSTIFKGWLRIRFRVRLRFRIIFRVSFKVRKGSVLGVAHESFKS